jgi:hypothetical protein
LNFANGKSYQKPKVHDRVESFESPSSNLRLTYIGTNPDLSAKILTNVIAELAKYGRFKQKNFTKTIAYLNERIAVLLKIKIRFKA